MDRFLEEAAVKRDRRVEELMYWVATALMAFGALLALMNFSALASSQNVLMDLMITVFMVVMAVYLYFFRDKLRTEYEYTFTNGQLEFAMVLNNKKRKNLGQLNVEKVDAFGRVQSGSFRRHTSSPDVKHLRWFLNRVPEKLYYFAFSKNGKKSVIVFEPSEEMVGMIKHYLPRGVYQEN